MKTTFLVLVLLTGVGFGRDARADGTPKILFDRLVYDFGKTGQVETVTGTFKYRNEGDGVLTIKPPESSCRC